MKNIVLVALLLWATRIQGDTQTSPTTTSEPHTDAVTQEPSLRDKNTRIKLSSYPPQTLGLENVVKSGPIVLVNKKTLFVPNLRYDGILEDAHFLVGNGSEPSEEGVVVPDENGSSNRLHRYQGNNIYLKLPGDLSTDSVEYFGVWSKDTDTNLGHVSLKDVHHVPDQLGFEERTADGKKIMRVPKCCPINSILTDSGCEPSDAVVFVPTVRILQHNDTHLNNESLDPNSFSFEPYTNSMQCASGKYFLDDQVDDFALLCNGSLIVRTTGKTGVLSQGDYCMEAIEDQPESLLMFICAPEFKINQAMFRAYIVSVVISTLCFAGTFILYYFVLKCKEIHKKCFMGYALSMCFTFLFLTIIQVAHVEDGGCLVLGFFFQFAMITSFTWLAIMCFDILFSVIYFDDNHKKGTRFWWYLGIAIGTPLLFFIISLCRKMPDVPDTFFKPQYGRNACYFEADGQRRILFYIPITVSIIISMICLGITKYKIVQCDKTMKLNYFWMDNARDYKFMLRRYIIIFITMLLWLIEGFISLGPYGVSGILMAINIIEAVQGIIILLLFVLNKEAKRFIMEALQASKRKKKRFTEEDFIMAEPMNSTNPETS